MKLFPPSASRLRLILPLLVLLCVGGGVSLWSQHLGESLTTARATHADWQQKHTQLSADIAASSQLKQKLKPATRQKKLFVPIDETATKQFMRDLALSEKLQITEQVLLTDTLPDKQPSRVTDLALVQKRLTLAGTAPYEAYVLRYAERLSEQLPGKLQLMRLQLDRTTTDEISSRPLRFKAEWQWLLPAKIDPAVTRP